MKTTKNKQKDTQEVPFNMDVTKKNVQNYIETKHNISMDALFSKKHKRTARFYTSINNTMYVFSKFYFNSRTGVFQTRLRQQYSELLRPVTDPKYTTFQNINSLDDLVQDIGKYKKIRIAEEEKQRRLDNLKAQEISQEQEQPIEQEP